MDNAIQCNLLSKSYGKKTAVQGLNLEVPTGSVFAFLGPNGAGKTTTIKMIMNILESSGGSATVLGTDVSKLTPENFRQIGYVSENQEMPEWMTVKQLTDYCQPFYPSWDADFCEQLVRQFDLPWDEKLKNLSRGMKVKAALVSTLAYRPKHSRL